ncbi:MAG: RNHCP domain-containing protein [Planctomycetota bacterium]
MSTDERRPRKGGRRDERGDFVCSHCKSHVPGVSFGTKHRNHCPLCLWSRHVDESPGDRACLCRAPMEPIAIAVREGDEWAIVHRCTACGAVRTNRIAGDDDEMALLALALRPLARPAFPIESPRRMGSW